MSFALSSEKKLADYTVNFDGDTAAAYGKLDKRSVEAGGTDRVEYTVTPKAANGELVLRLLLGKTEVNTLRFSNLAVEEAPANQSGANKMLVDKLNYAAPGAIRCAAEAGYSAEMSSTDTSATMSITNVPSSKDAAVWKLKLMVATGLKPEPGKTYRFRATLNSNNSGSYEVCYNEGEVEKGYDVLYNQSLKRGNQTVERMIYVPTDKENPGELIVQFSLGKLSKGTKVTISKVTVEEASPAYTNALAKDFALDYTENYDRKFFETGITATSTTPETLPLDWNQNAFASVKGGKADALTFDTNGNPQIHISAGSTNAWEAMLYLETNMQLEVGYYQVDYDIESNITYGYYAVQNGNGCDPSNGDNNEKYGKINRSYAVADTAQHESYKIKVDEVGKLLITFQLGQTNQAAGIVTVSNLRIKLSEYVVPVPNNCSLTESSKSSSSLAINDDKIIVHVAEGSPGHLDATGINIETGFKLLKDKKYHVHFNISTDSDGGSGMELYLNKNGSGTDGSFGHFYTWDGGGLTWLNKNEERLIDLDTSILTDDDHYLTITLMIGENAGTFTISDLQITSKDNSVDGYQARPWLGDFYVEPTKKEVDSKDHIFTGTIVGNGSSATLCCSDGTDNNAWERQLRIQCCGLVAGQSYTVSFYLKANKAGIGYEVLYSGGNEAEMYGAKKSLTTDTSLTPIQYDINDVTSNNTLVLRLQLGKADTGDTITIQDIKVTPKNPPEASPRFLMAGQKISGPFTSSLSKVDGGVKMNITRDSGTPDWDGAALLQIHTGLVPTNGSSGYRVSFKLHAQKALPKFHVAYGFGYGDWETQQRRYGGVFNKVIGEDQTMTIVEDIYANGATEPIVIQLHLGLLEGTNEFTVSDVKVYKNTIGLIQTGGESGITGTVTNDMQEGYSVPLTRAKDSATVSINKTPATGMEAWKHKLFIDTGVNVNEGEAYRVVFDTLAENDMDFEVCYNRGSTEKGFTAVYGLHAAAGKTKTVEKMVFAENSGKLIVQLSLGNVSAPNKVTVSNLRVERVKYSYSGKSALPAEISYQAGDVSYWAHADYAASFTNTADSITAHITPPAKNPEPWKVKLFLDTGVALQGGKYYKVTTDVSAKKSQNYEICYNNGGMEFGYDSMGGLKVTGGKTERIEKLISVPAGKKDTNNLMLQFNLGKTAIANEVTISNVTVEEVTLAYANAMGKDFSYQKSLSTWTDPKTTYKAIVESANSAATLHISDVPASGTGVWMVKLFVHTGAMLEAGKSYQVSADLLAAKAQDFETCFNNEETEKGFDAIYGQKLAAGVKTTVDKRISVPASMTDAGELVLQFSVGGAVANDITVSNISVQELQYGGSGDASPVPDTVIDLSQSAQAAGTLDVSREKLTYHMTKIAAGAKDNAIKIAGAALRSNDLYTVAFTAKADKELTGTLALAPSGGKAAVISEQFTLTPTEQTYAFTTADALADGGDYDIFWQFGSADNQKLGSADVDLSNISVYVPAEHLSVSRSVQKVTVNGKAVSPDIYGINGFNYFKLRDLAVLLNGTNGQFVVRYNGQTNAISLTSGKEYTPIGGELAVGADLSARCSRSSQTLSLNGRPVSLKAFNIGGYNYFRLRDLGTLLGFDVDYEAKTNTVLIASPLTPERQEASYAYNVFFRPEIDGESQPYVGDTMPFYDNGTYYIYYLKEGGDSYNHSVYLTTTRDFVSYQEYDDPVLSASRADVQDSWIGTGSVVKVDKNYYFFYTGFNASGSQEYHEKIMVAKGSSPTSFTKVGGWSITPPAELNQKNDFRDPQAYYDPATGTISLTVTASKDGTARILKYTLGKDLSSVKYDGVIFTDPTGAFYNLECSDTFRLGNKWYLTYSGQEDTLWYASADSRFGPYSAPKRMDGTLFYAAKHVENGKNSYMVGWTRRSASASSTDEVSGWGGNLAVQQLRQNADGSLSMIPVDSIASAFNKSVALSATSATLTAGSGYSYKKAFTSSESFKLTGEFTCAGTGSLGLAFDFDGTEDQYKLISVDPAEGKLKLLFNGGATQIAETQAKVAANQKHTFTYIQDGSVGIFYLDGQAALTVRLYGVTDKPIYLFAENNSVTFTSLRQFTR